MTQSERTWAGAAERLVADGKLLTKVGSTPVVVFWDGRAPHALEDRCPHMGFPLHRGTVADGMVTCHWHHARFDLVSGCTLDLFADDARGFDAGIEGDRVWVAPRPVDHGVVVLERRLREGMQEGLTLVIAKSVLGLLGRGEAPTRVLGLGMAFGAAYRAAGWGAGMTVAQIAANLLPFLPPDDQARAVTQALSFLARDTRGGPFFPVAPLSGDVPVGQLAAWYRGFVENREGEAAERALATAVRADRASDDLPEVERFLFAACTDHVYLDEGHIVDYTNKAFEALGHLGPDAAGWLLPTLVRQTASATRHEERSDWRTPIDLLPLADKAIARLAEDRHEGAGVSDDALAASARALLADDPHEVMETLLGASAAGATAEQLARAVALAAALRLVHFHVQNDVGDWDTVHHTFTTANAVHQAICRNPTPELLRGVVHGALRVYLDRFLNVPAARLPSRTARSLDELEACWEARSGVDEAGAVVAGFLASGGDASDVVAELCRALYREDAGFHWHQAVDAGARQHQAWPVGSPESELVLVGVTRWLVAHTPTLRQNDQVVTIARRLQRGEPVFEEPADT